MHVNNADCILFRGKKNNLQFHLHCCCMQGEKQRDWRETIPNSYGSDRTMPLQPCPNSHLQTRSYAGGSPHFAPGCQKDAHVGEREFSKASLVLQPFCSGDETRYLRDFYLQLPLARGLLSCGSLLAPCWFRRPARAQN